MYDGLDLRTWHWSVRRAVCDAWMRLAPDVKAVLRGVKVYSSENLHCNGDAVYGYALQSTKSIYLREDGVVANIVMVETAAHELAHLYLGAIGGDYTSEDAVKALLVRWGFERERQFGRFLIGD